MSIKRALQEVYAKHPNVAGLASLRKNKDIKTVYLEGMHGSCASLFASASVKTIPGIHVFILNDLEEAGYFYHDLVQVDGEADILFFPSSYRRAIKYGQKDAANEILRTEVLSRLEQKKPVTVVTYPEGFGRESGFTETTLGCDADPESGTAGRYGQTDGDAFQVWV